MSAKVEIGKTVVLFRNLLICLNYWYWQLLICLQMCNPMIISYTFNGDSCSKVPAFHGRVV